MCKISDKVIPRWPIPHTITFLARFFTTWANAHVPTLLFKSVKVDEKKVIVYMNPKRYRGKPMLGNVVEGMLYFFPLW